MTDNPHLEIMSALRTIQSQNIAILNRLDKIAPEGIMTRKQISEEYQISLPTIHNAMKRGQLASFKVGGSRRFKRQDVEEWRNLK